MKLTIVCKNYPPDIGGPAIYVQEISRRLILKGDTVNVVTSSRTATKEPNVYATPKSLFFSLRFLGFLMEIIWLFLTISIVSRGSQLIYVQNPTIHGFISIIVGFAFKKPVILKFVGDKPWEYAYNRNKTNESLDKFLDSVEKGFEKDFYIKFLFILQKFVFKYVDKIIVPSYFLKNILMRHYNINGKKIKVIYNSAIEPKCLSSNTLKNQNQVIVTVGRLIRAKNINGIIEAINTCTKDFPCLELYVIGDGPERKNLEDLAISLGLKESVKFFGSVDHDEVLNLILISKIVILNSLYEGLPHVLIEAMACQSAIIATDIDGTREVIENGISGLLISPLNTEMLSEKIKSLLRDEEFRKKLSNNGHNVYSNKFNWEKNINILRMELQI